MEKDGLIACWIGSSWDFSSLFHDYLKEKQDKAEKVGWSQIMKNPDLNNYYGFQSASNGKTLKIYENESCLFPHPVSLNSGVAQQLYAWDRERITRFPLAGR